jgi:hypothetical protein
MPSADAILAGLTDAANTWRVVAILWHLIVAAVLFAYWTSGQLSNRSIAVVAVGLVGSVSVVSAVTGNPFNAAVFGGLAILLATAATRARSARIRLEEPVWAVPGAVLVLFGMAYPHFLTTQSWTEYAFAAPLGLIPCPTLAVVIGVTVMFRNVGSTAWTAPLIVAGLVYGLVGVFALGVLLDVALLAGTLVLTIAAVTSYGRRSVRPHRRERTCPLPGDEFILKPFGTITHGITITGAPGDVWPWLAQMGAGSRAGWYSYDVLDNGRRRSADRVIPELQGITIGTLFPGLPGITDGFRVLAYEPDKFLVLGWPDPTGTPLVSWAFVLERRGDGATRLTVRVRAGAGYRFRRLPSWLSKPVVRVVHFVMQRKQLLGIAARVEGAASMRDAPARQADVERRAS